ncbi:uncharacterized protein LOC141719548 [Apium graveolens]|uniref:uncharacterized protein LOC141719548 n=1 Tax=Apium graveolens TaxID=4045 RepID=UPI003D79949E
MCVEGLSAIMRRYEEAGLLHGCKVARGAPSISHLLFTDDCYFFFRASQTEAAIMKDILVRYERLSGQVVNYSKSSITFSPNTHEQVKKVVCEKLQVMEIDKPGKYLGMLMCVRKNKMETFVFLSDGIEKKLQGWSNKELPKGGKLLLLKSAAQTIPSFWMSLFLIPVTLCEEMERIMNAFWWGHGQAGKGVRLMA